MESRLGCICRNTLAVAISVDPREFEVTEAEFRSLMKGLVDGIRRRNASRVDE